MNSSIIPGKMKAISIIMGIAFIVVSAVMVSLIRKGGALKPAGVIKPAEISQDHTLIGRQIAVRLYPDFQEAKHVVWRVEGGSEELASIAREAFAHYRSPTPHTLHDLRTNPTDTCADACWYIQDLRSPLPVPQAAEVFVQYFDREEKVPEACDAEKILDPDCMRSVSVREVHRKLKTQAPYYFMQRYKQAQFYLFIERRL